MMKKKSPLGEGDQGHFPHRWDQEWRVKTAANLKRNSSPVTKGEGPIRADPRERGGSPSTQGENVTNHQKKRSDNYEKFTPFGNHCESPLLP